jgi:hypothetical protein
MKSSWTAKIFKDIVLNEANKERRFITEKRKKTIQYYSPYITFVQKIKAQNDNRKKYYNGMARKCCLN